MKLYLIRHGQTTGNRDNRIQGWGDVPLSELGEAQARELGERISSVKFDRIYCSDIYRTRCTCDLVFGPDRERIYDPRIREINNSKMAGRLRSDVVAEFGEENFIAAAHSLDYSRFGGESLESLKTRVADFLADMDKLEGECEKIAVVTHGGTIRAFMMMAFGMTPDVRLIDIDNCSVTVLAHCKKPTISGGTWQLRHINNHFEF